MNEDDWDKVINDPAEEFVEEYLDREIEFLDLTEFVAEQDHPYAEDLDEFYRVVYNRAAERLSQVAERFRDKDD